MDLLGAKDTAQNRSFCRMLISHSAMHCWWCVLTLDWIVAYYVLLTCVTILIVVRALARLDLRRCRSRCHVSVPRRQAHQHILSTQSALDAAVPLHCRRPSRRLVTDRRHVTPVMRRWLVVGPTSRLYLLVVLTACFSLACHLHRRLCIRFAVLHCLTNR